MSDEKSKKKKKYKKYEMEPEKSIATISWPKFPTLKQIETAINDAVKPVGKALNSLAQTFRKEANKITGSIVGGVTGSYDKIKAAVDAAVHFIKLMYSEMGQWLAEDAFRERLDGFFNDLLKLAEEPGRILLDLKINIDPTFICKIINDIPTVVLYPVAQGLDTIPGWDQMPKKLLDVAKKLPSLHEEEQELCGSLLAHPEIVTTVKDTRLLLKVVEKTLDLATSLLPKDLSVNASVLGEGGGTEVTGHPAKVPFETAKWILGLTDQAFTAYLNRYDACAQAKYQKEVEDRLAAIEKAVGAKS